ncbi:MAG: hypothetical protein WCX31_12945 [Salinivirgaceae bacterium]
MKRGLFQIMILFSYFGICQAQNKGETTLADLQSPSSPAFTILGVQPNEISKPYSLNALVTTMYSSFVDNNNLVIPKNFAMEFSPYWINSHHKLFFDEYINPSCWQSIKQNSSISLATTQIVNKIDTSNINSKMGIGFRTMIFNGKIEDNNNIYSIFNQESNLLIVLQKNATLFKILITPIGADNIDTLIAIYDREFKSAIKDLSDEDEKESIIHFNEALVLPFLKKNKAQSKSQVELVKNNLIQIIDDELENKLKEKAKNIQKYSASTKRTGFFLEFAYSLLLDFPTNNIDYSKVTKWGVWLTPSYRWYYKNQYIDILGITRYIRNSSTLIIDSIFTDNFDYGIGIKFEDGKYSINGEIIGRYQSRTISKEQIDDVTITKSKKYSDIHYSINLNYKISENIIMSYSFGSNFQKNTEYNSSLISMLSLSYGFGGITNKSIKGM